jgi:signal transduction histidine kinase
MEYIYKRKIFDRYKFAIFFLSFFLQFSYFQLSAEKNDSLKIFLNEQIKGIQTNLNQNPDQQLDLIEEALMVSDENKFLHQKAELIRLKGLSFFYKGNFGQALDLFHQSQKLFIALNDINGEASALNNISVIYRKMGYLDKSLELSLQILSMREKGKDSLKIASGYNNLAVSYMDFNDYDKALDYYNKTVAIYLRMNVVESIDLSYNNIGKLYMFKGFPDSALYYFQKSLEYSKPLNHKQMMANSYIYIGEYYFNKNEYTKAKYFYLVGLKLAKETGIVYEIEWAAESLQKVYNQIGDYKNAYNFHVLYKQMADSTYKMEIIQKITHMEAELKFENELELNQIKMEKRELENKLEITHQKQVRNIAIALVFVFLLLSTLVYRNYLNKKRDNVLLTKQKEEILLQNNEIQKQRDQINELNKTKDKFFAIIAHDLKNPLGGISKLSEVIYLNYDYFSPDKIKTYLLNIKLSTEKAYELLENLLQWALLQLGTIQVLPTQFNLTDLLRENVDLLSVFAEQKKIKIEIDENPDFLVFADKSMINTVVRNLITNAIKFTHESGIVQVFLMPFENQYRITVKDNGIGISDEDLSQIFNLKTEKRKVGTAQEKGTGLGLILCKEFTLRNGGQIWVESEIGQGTSFHFTVPANL